jgi:ABC-type transport system involved in multi-copper enzyme maturation permease subunit
MIGVVLRLELRRSRSLAVWLCVVVLVYGAFIAAFYPFIRDNAKLLDDYMAVLPKGMLAAFGLEGGLSNHGVFFNTYIAGMLWPIVAAIAGIILGTRMAAADLDRGFIELPLATRIDRVRYLATGVIGQILVLGALSLAAVGGMLVVGVVVGAGFDAGRFLMEVPLLFLFACALGAIATLLSVITLSRAGSAGVVAGGLLAMYLLDAVSRLQADLDWIGTPSAFRYLRSTSAIDLGVMPLGPMALFGAIAVAAWGVAVWRFRTRDLVA